MIVLSSTAELAGALRRARSVTFGTYLLPHGPVLAALEDACRRGARVVVRLDGTPFRDRAAARANIHELARLRALGAEVHAGRQLHLKGAVVDGVAYLDDRNWVAGDAQTIVRDDDARDVRAVAEAIAGRRAGVPAAGFATRKADALDGERALLDSARANEDIVVESESFGYGPQIFPALERLARAGRHVRLLVDRRTLSESPRESGALARLSALGVEVRACDAAEKFALCGARAWLGSANATFAEPHERDWGARTADPAIVAHLRAAFETRWRAAKVVA